MSAPATNIDSKIKAQEGIVGVRKQAVAAAEAKVAGMTPFQRQWGMDLAARMQVNIVKGLLDVELKKLDALYKEKTNAKAAAEIAAKLAADLKAQADKIAADKAAADAAAKKAAEDKARADAEAKAKKNANNAAAAKKAQDEAAAAAAKKAAADAAAAAAATAAKKAADDAAKAQADAAAKKATNVAALAAANAAKAQGLSSTAVAQVANAAAAANGGLKMSRKISNTNIGGLQKPITPMLEPKMGVAGVPPQKVDSAIADLMRVVDNLKASVTAASPVKGGARRSRGTRRALNKKRRAGTRRH